MWAELRRYLLSRWLNLLLVFLPVVLILEVMHGGGVWLFACAALILSVLVVALVSLDGETNWFEGVQLIAVYLILGIAFYFVPGK